MTDKENLREKENEAADSKDRKANEQENHRRSGASLKKMIKNRALLIFYGLVVIGALVGGIIFCIFNFFKINTVNIEGTGLYSDEEILEAAGINTGDSLVFADLKGAEERLESKLLYIEDVSLNRRIPSTLNITIITAIIPKEISILNPDTRINDALNMTFGT